MSELQALRDRVDELEQVLGLDFDIPPSFRAGTSRAPAWRLLCHLAKRGRSTKEGALIITCGDQDIDRRPDIKLLDVLICYLRRHVLAPHGVVLETVWGEGWRFDADNRRKALALIERYGAGEI